MKVHRRGVMDTPVLQARKLHLAAKRVRPVSGHGPSRLDVKHGLVPDLDTFNFALTTMFDHPERVQVEAIREAGFKPTYAWFYA